MAAKAATYDKFLRALCREGDLLIENFEPLCHYLRCWCLSWVAAFAAMTGTAGMTAPSLWART